MSALEKCSLALRSARMDKSCQFPRMPLQMNLRNALSAFPFLGSLSPALFVPEGLHRQL